jgi:hypothetical protein
MQKFMLTLGLSAMAAAAFATAASADRKPTPGERAHVSGILSANGFTAWKKIELDDGKWEVDDARHANGRVYDVDIRGGVIVKKDLED